MTPELLQNLRAQSTVIRDRWETLLRIERVSGPLANPDALVHLIPDSLDRILRLAAAHTRTSPSLAAVRAGRLPPCDCGNNPYLAYFVAGEQAIVEAAILLQAEMSAPDRREGDIAKLTRAVRQLASSEIDAFCGICTHRGAAAHCRHALAAVRYKHEAGKPASCL